MIIRDKQIIAMQFFTPENNSEDSFMNFEEIPDPVIVPDGDHSKSQSRVDLVDYGNDNAKIDRQITSQLTRNYTRNDPGLPRDDSKSLIRKESHVSDKNETRSMRSGVSARSARSGVSSRYGGRTSTIDKMGTMLKETVPILFELYEEFKSFDKFIEDVYKGRLKEDIRNNPIADLIPKIKLIREEIYNIFEKQLNLQKYIDDKENLEIKNFVILMRDNLLDSLALRSIQVITV